MLKVAGWAFLILAVIHVVADPGNMPVPFVVFGTDCEIVGGLCALYFAAKLGDRSDS